MENGLNLYMLDIKIKMIPLKNLIFIFLTISIITRGC